MSKIIGIDLGTTNSCVCIWENGEPRVIQNAEGARTTPSVVAFKDEQVLVGTAAKQQALINPENTLYSIKRLIGRRYDDAEVQKAHELVPFKIVKGEHDDARVEVKGKPQAPQQISAHVLQKMRKTAEDYLGEKVTQAVITVPAYFDDSQRQATKDAGKIAGLEVKRVINEPTAAALAYVVDKSDKNKKIAMFDLGGGTFDISIIKMADEIGQFEVLSTNGDTFLGGDDFDQALIQYLVGEFKKSQGVDLQSNDIKEEDKKLALQRLKEAAEKAKIDLSSVEETEIILPYLIADASGPKNFLLNLTRAKLEGLVAALIARCEEPCKIALQDSDSKVQGKVDEVILVGGMTRMPAVQKKVTDIFGCEPRKNINPDEAVAMGAAIQAGKLQGDVGGHIVMQDVTPLSLGVETVGDVMDKLIKKNTIIPTKIAKIFSTASDNQTSVDIRVFQGEHEVASGNKLLGEFVLGDISPAPRGVPKIEVTFDIDANGILNVSAKNKETGKTREITIKNSCGLSADEIEQMVQEAKAHTEKDKEMEQLTEARNQCDAFIASVQQRLSQKGDGVADADKQKIESAISNAEDAAKGVSIDDINAAMRALEQAAAVLKD